MTTLNDLHNLAQTLGVTVTYCTMPKDFPLAYYHHPTKTIRIHHNLPPNIEKCVLAHELGHAAHSHTTPKTQAEHIRQEQQADLWAAKTLISVPDYIKAEKEAGPWPSAIAAELDVTINLVNIWRHWWQRTHPR